MKESWIFLSLGILAFIGVLLTSVLIKRARSFEKRAARIVRQMELTTTPSPAEASPSLKFRVVESSPSIQEATPSMPGE